MSQLFASGGQSIGVSASTLVLPMNTQAGLVSFRMDWLDLLASITDINKDPPLTSSSAHSTIVRSSWFEV